MTHEPHPNQCCEQCATDIELKVMPPTMKCQLDYHCPCHKKAKEEWRERLSRLCDKNIAVDGGAVGTKYVHEIEDFIAALLASERATLLTSLSDEVDGMKGGYYDAEAYNAAIFDVQALIRKRM